MQEKRISDRMFLFESLQNLCLFICLAINIKVSECQEIVTVTETTFCYNSSLEGFRLDAAVLEVRNVSLKSACIDECLAEPCCRSVNYQHNTLYNQSKKCEFLHDLVPDTFLILQKNSSFDYVYFLKPQKEYNSDCYPEEIVPEVTYVSCKEAFDKTNRFDGVYSLQLNDTSEVYQVYCHMSNLSSQCGFGGWTLVMKVDGNKGTFKHDSPFWANSEIFNLEGGLNGLEENETLLASYVNTPFTKICVGMKVGNVTNWIQLNHTASSLHSVIAYGTEYSTNLGPAKWQSLFVNKYLQPYCNKEGFNVKVNRPKTHVRIGIATNNEDDCNSPDSFIGFGFKNHHDQDVSCGFSYFRTAFPAFGFIFVQ